MSTPVGSLRLAEWKRYPLLPVAAAMGYGTSMILTYGLGPYIVPFSEAFGWTRTQVTAGLTIYTIVWAIFAVPIGLLVDRVGARVLALIGTFTMTGAFALLGAASGNFGQWLVLWTVLAVVTLPVQATVWTSAVATRFEASRGMALAVVMCGASVALIILPVMGTWLIRIFGWRTALMMQGVVWFVVVFPMVLLFFRGAHDRQAGGVRAKRTERPEIPGTSLAEGIRSSIYLRLVFVSLTFSLTIIALVVHFVPLLTGRGADPLRAAGIASLIGIFSIIGRLTTGLVLDRLRGSLVGAAVFILPALGCLALLLAGDSSFGQAVAAALIGLALGAEIDVIFFLTSQYFGLRAFGGLSGGSLMAMAIGLGVGHSLASALFDSFGDYDPFLWLTLALMIACSLALASLPRPAFATRKVEIGILSVATQSAGDGP